MNQKSTAVEGAIEREGAHRIPNGVVAVLVGADGREIANAADFDAGAPAGFRRQEAQESRARRALALATMNALASPRLVEAIDACTAERIMRTMCNEGGCRVVIVAVGNGG
jgi:hypothetical protein